MKERKVANLKEQLHVFKENTKWQQIIGELGTAFQEHLAKTGRENCFHVVLVCGDIAFEYNDQYLFLYTTWFRRPFGRPFLIVRRREGWSATYVDFSKLSLVSEAIEALCKLNLEADDKNEETRDEMKVFNDYLDAIADL
jgi:hypothetical protein